MPRVKLTKSAIDALPTPASDVVYWDAGLPGFGIKVTPKGRKVFVVLYRTGGAGSKLRKYTIGPYGRVTLHQARVAAQKVFAAKLEGRDQAAEKRAARRPIVADRGSVRGLHCAAFDSKPFRGPLARPGPAGAPTRSRNVMSLTSSPPLSSGGARRRQQGAEGDQDVSALVRGANCPRSIPSRGRATAFEGWRSRSSARRQRTHASNASRSKNRWPVRGDC